ncbi:MAG: DUF4386 domain-containing protein [Acidimicrobiia bacterium]|jgi:hypothetical protein
MLSERTTARLVGILFIVATATAIAGGALLLPLDEADYLTNVLANEGQVLSGVLLELILVLSVIGIAVMFHPVLKRHDDGLSLGYIGARTVEGVLLLAASVSALLVLALARDYGEPGATGVQPLGDLVLASREWTYLLGSMVLLGVGGLILYPMLYRSKLIPPWLSLWGLLGAALILARGLLEMYGVEFSGVMQAIFAAPIALQEMVMALWLIISGFDSDHLKPIDEPIITIQASVKERV